MIASLLLLPFLGCDNEPAAQAPAHAEPAAEPVAETHTEAAEAHTEPAEAAAAKAGEWTHYGSAFTLTDAMPATELLGAPEKFVDQTVLVEGRVTDVCQKAGCWMVMSDGSQEIRVLMKEHGFSVDKDGAGALARVQGTLEAVEVSPDEVAHLEGESARADLMPEKKGMKYRLIATGAAFLGKPAPTEG